MKQKKRAVRRPSASADTTDMLSFIVENMATRDDFAALRSELRTEMHEDFGRLSTELRDIKNQLRDIERRLGTLEEQSHSHGGFAKEIDALRAEIHAIKKHVGLPR